MINLKKEHASLTLLLLRLWLGIAMIWHSYPVLFQGGIDGFTGYITSLGIPLASVLAPVAKIVEFGCGLMVLAGVYTRQAAVLLTINFVIALGVGHSFIALGEGELAANYLVISVALATGGGGMLTLKK